MLAHGIHTSESTGNPGRFACFLDESINKDLAAVCKSCHAVTFERTALAKFASRYSSSGAGGKGRLKLASMRAHWAV